MSIDNNQEVINTVSIDDVNLGNLGQGYVDDDNNNKVEVKEEPKHFLQVLREAIDKQIKIIEEEKKTKANKEANAQNENVEEHRNLPRPIDNNEAEQGSENEFDGYEVETI